MKVCDGTNFSTTAQNLKTAVSIMDINGSRHHTDDLASLLRLCASGFMLHSLRLQPMILIRTEWERDGIHLYQLNRLVVHVLLRFIGTCSPAQLLTTDFDLSPAVRGVMVGIGRGCCWESLITSTHVWRSKCDGHFVIDQEQHDICILLECQSSPL